MATTSLSRVVELLRDSLTADEQRDSLIRQFQDKIWNTDPAPGEEWAWGLLRDLAYDLDYYEPDVKEREDEASYFGSARCRDLIVSALKQLEERLSGGESNM